MKDYRYLLISKREKFENEDPVKAAIFNQLVKELEIDKMISILQGMKISKTHEARLANKAKKLLERLETKN